MTTFAQASTAPSLRVFTALQMVFAKDVNNDQDLAPQNAGSDNMISYTFATDGSFTVPANCTAVNVNWLIAGGGGGGGGGEGGYGGAGGGGGSGGWVSQYLIDVAEGDVISFTIGAGGTRPASFVTRYNGLEDTTGTDGGDTVVLKNGNQVYRVTGGAGGHGAINPGSGANSSPAPGGVGGSPGGNSGDTGAPGTGDRASGVGAVGGAGPMDGAVGGAAGTAGGGDPLTGASAGGNGGGYGSGGGGAGFHDRQGGGVNYWAGGNGVGGYAQATAIIHIPAPTTGPSDSNGDGNPTAATYTANLLDCAGFVRFDTENSGFSNAAVTTFQGYDDKFGSIAAIAQINESVATSAPRVAITFFPPDTQCIALLTDPQQQGANVRIWWGIMDDATGLPACPPEEVFFGFVDTCVLQVDVNTQSVQIEVGSVFERMFIASEGQRLNNQFHQVVWPGETGLSQVIEAQANTPWGVAGSVPPFQQYSLSPTLGDRIAGTNAGGLSTGRAIYDG